MQKYFILFISFLVSFVSFAQKNKKPLPKAETASIQPTYSPEDVAAIRKVYDEALTNGKSYEHLRFLCKNIGARLSASPQALQAVEWGRDVMKQMGFDTVFLQPCYVPQWVRGAEEGAIVSSNKNIAAAIETFALGGSVPTPISGIKAEVIEVHDFDELISIGPEKIKGKIVFFNRPMNQKEINTFNAYGGCVNQRISGAAEAAKMGASAVLVRSMTLLHDEHPHTGSVHYDSLAPKIPAAAISTNSADELSKKLKEDPRLEFLLRLGCQTLPEVLSYNVIGEIKGSEFPKEYIAVGGHLDSWDKGEGAHDDGAGIVQSMEVLRLFKDLGIRPKHTLRAVLFMNEENGAKGAIRYADDAAKNKEKHIFAMESDRGGFTPRGFSLDMDSTLISNIQTWKPLLAPYGLHDLIPGGAGVDVGPLKRQGVPLAGYIPDPQRYFDYHHADTDVFEAVNQRELELGGASMAALIYLIDKYWVK